MPSGLSSPRSRASVLADLGERSAFVDGQRVGRPRRLRPSRRTRLRRLVGVIVAVAVIPAAVVAGGHWLLTTQRFAVTSVEERRPFTLVHGGRLHWMDEEGRLLGASLSAVAPPMPVISGLTADELASMRTAPGPKARAAVAVIRALLRSGSGLTAEISEIDMSRREGPVLYTVDGVEVRLGTEDWDERLARLEGVLAQIATQDVRAVDLRFRDQVVFQRGEAR